MSQCMKILKYLQEGNHLTQAQAVDKWRCYRLSGRIHDLRHKGYDILCYREPNVGNSGTHGVYYMEVMNNDN